MIVLINVFLLFGGISNLFFWFLSKKGIFFILVEIIGSLRVIVLIIFIGVLLKLVVLMKMLNFEESLIYFFLFSLLVKVMGRFLF